MSQPGGEALDPRAVLAALLRDEDEARAAADRLGVPADALGPCRDALLEAALTRLGDLVQPKGWVQADVSLRGTVAEYSRLAQGPLLERLSELAASGIATDVWYLHKPPGLRLRLEGDRARLRAALAPVLDELVAAGAATGWAVGTYLPETHLFGGPTGMRLAHRFFTADSLAVLAFHRIRYRGRATLAPAEFSFLLLDGCLARLVPDPWERWDVWCRLRGTGRIVDPAPPGAPVGSTFTVPEESASWVRAARSFPGPWPGVSAEEHKILADYQLRLGALADEVADGRASGELAATLRQSLPFWIVFHWNRMLFSLEGQRALTRIVVAALDPRGPATTA